MRDLIRLVVFPSLTACRWSSLAGCVDRRPWHGRRVARSEQGRRRPLYLGLVLLLIGGIRQALEERGPDGRPTLELAHLARMLDTRGPEILVTVGGVGMAALVWLMVMKPR